MDRGRPLTGVKELGVPPFPLVVVQRPQVDYDTSSLPHCEVADAAEEHRDGERGGVDQLLIRGG